MFTLSIDPSRSHTHLRPGRAELRAAIATGRVQPGDQLPTVRQLAVDLLVNANTVARVYAELERQGVLETRRGVGTFIAAGAPRAVPARERRRLLAGFLTRVIADAAMAGFTMDELLDGLKARHSGGEP